MSQLTFSLYAHLVILYISDAYKVWQKGSNNGWQQNKVLKQWTCGQRKELVDLEKTKGEMSRKKWGSEGKGEGLKLVVLLYFRQFIFVGSHANSLLSLRKLGPVWTVSLIGIRPPLNILAGYPEVRSPQNHSDLPQRTWKLWWKAEVKKKNQTEGRRDYFISALVLFVGLYGNGNT